MDIKSIALETPLLITKDLSIGKPLHTQRNNELNPNGACGPTSAANAIVSANSPFVYDKKQQLEDYIMRFLMSKRALAYLQKLHPGATYHPWNSSECIVWAINTLAKQTICELQENNLQGILFNLAVKNNPVVLGGAFTENRHFVCTVGFNSKQSDILQVESPQDIDLKYLVSLIIDDSWGNFMTHYKNKDGNSIVLPADIYRLVAMDNKKIKTTQVYFANGIKG